MSVGPARNPPKTRTSFGVFRNYTLFRQLAAFQKRFRLLEFPLAEIRPEFDRNASNAGMLQSEMPHLAKCQKFRRVSTRRQPAVGDDGAALGPALYRARYGLASPQTCEGCSARKSLEICQRCRLSQHS